MNGCICYASDRLIDPLCVLLISPHANLLRVGKQLAISDSRMNCSITLNPSPGGTHGRQLLCAMQMLALCPAGQGASRSFISHRT